MIVDVRERAGGFEVTSSVEVILQDDRLRVPGAQEAIVRVTFLDGEKRTTVLRGGELALRAPSSFTAYVKLGAVHILTGVDHLMFVLALVMLVQAAAACCSPSPPSPRRTASR